MGRCSSSDGDGAVTLDDEVVNRMWHHITNDPQYLLIESTGAWSGPHVDVLFGAFEGFDDNGPNVVFRRLPGEILRRGEWLEPMRQRRPSLLDYSASATPTEMRVRRWAMCNVYATLTVAAHIIHDHGLQEWWPINPTAMTSTAGLAVFRLAPWETRPDDLTPPPLIN